MPHSRMHACMEHVQACNLHVCIVHVHALLRSHACGWQQPLTKPALNHQHNTARYVLCAVLSQVL